MASTMYRLPPIVDSAATEIRLPTCMYRMAPVTQTCAPQDAATAAAHRGQAADGGAAAADVARLERRQEAILARLAELRAQVEAAQLQLGGGGTVSMQTDSVDDAPPEHYGGDMVVVAAAARPPYSLLPLRRLLPSLEVTSHVHSALRRPVDPRLVRLFTWSGQQGGAHLRVIWKLECGEPALLVSAAGQSCPLSGEDQLCRYLARALLPHHYEGGAGGLERAARVDVILEEARGLGGKQPQAALRSLEVLLGADPFLLGGTMTLVDAAVWSCFRSAAAAAPSKLAAWSARVAQAAGIDEASLPATSQGGGDKKGAAAERRSETVTSSTPADKPKKDTGPPPASVAATNAPPASGKPSKKNRQHQTAAAVTPNKASTPPPPAAPATPGATGDTAAAAPPGGHMDERGLQTYLDGLDITMETIRHPPVLTVEAMMPYLTNITGAITKNLFLKDKKKNLYVMSARHDAQFKLNDVAKQISGAKELRFGDETVMFELLGVRQGCVTAYALANDKEKKVKFLADAALVDGSFETVWFHPMTNEATAGMSVAEFKRFLSASGHEPILLKL